MQKIKEIVREVLKMSFLYENISEEQEERLRDEYEYYDEWKSSDAWDEGVSLDAYEEHCKRRDYGLDEEY
jgi:hypothetical protein